MLMNVAVRPALTEATVATWQMATSVRVSLAGKGIDVVWVSRSFKRITNSYKSVIIIRKNYSLSKQSWVTMTLNNYVKLFRA